MTEKMAKIRSEALAKIEESLEMDKLNEIRVAYLCKKGEVAEVVKGMRNVSPEDRPKVGQMVNDTRAAIEAKLEETKNAFAAKMREEDVYKRQAGLPHERGTDPEGSLPAGTWQE